MVYLTAAKAEHGSAQLMLVSLPLTDIKWPRIINCMQNIIKRAGKYKHITWNINTENFYVILKTSGYAY